MPKAWCSNKEPKELKGYKCKATNATSNPFLAIRAFADFDRFKQFPLEELELQDLPAIRDPITKEEFSRIAQILYMDSNFTSKEMLDEQFEKMDTNKDGVIQIEEVDKDLKDD